MGTAARRGVAFLAVGLAAIAGQALGTVVAFVTLRRGLGIDPFEDSSQLTPVLLAASWGIVVVASTCLCLRALVRLRILSSAEARNLPDFLRGSRTPKL